jgi:RNA polymerase primary sigma factor
LSNSLSMYKEIGKHQLLSRAEEVKLAQLMEGGDKRARDELVSNNMRLAISIARRYSNSPGVDFDDLFQESTIGLMKAIDRFDWRKGFKLSTYATWWIKQAVRQHLTVQSSSIRLPAGVHGLIFRAKRASDEYFQEFGVQPTLEELAEILQVEVSSLSVLMQTSKYTLSLDSPAMMNEDGDSPTLAETIPGMSDADINETMDKARIAVAIRKGLAMLTPREEKIIRLRFGITEDLTDHKNYPITTNEVKILAARSVK